MLGRKVEVPEPLTRVALLGGPTGQIAYILGARGQLCAVTKSLKTSELIKIMDPSVAQLAAPRSVSGQVNLEELLAADPQLVIAGDLDGSLVEKKTRIPVAYFQSSMEQTFDEMAEEVRFYGRVFHKEARAEKYAQYLRRTVDLIQSRVKDIPNEKRKVVFNGYSSNHLVTLGGDTFMQKHIELAGCRNAAEKLRSTRNQRRVAHGVGGSVYGKGLGMESRYPGDRFGITFGCVWGFKMEKHYCSEKQSGGQTTDRSIYLGPAHSGIGGALSALAGKDSLSGALQGY